MKLLYLSPSFFICMEAEIAGQTTIKTKAKQIRRSRMIWALRTRLQSRQKAKALIALPSALEFPAHFKG
jgi:hypothetical protein